jgi:hypothetical protein
MPNYRLAATAQAGRLQVAAEAAAADASRDIQHANDYVLAVVLFSAALFFGGHLQPPARSPPTCCAPRPRLCAAGRNAHMGRDLPSQHLDLDQERAPFHE